MKHRTKSQVRILAPIALVAVIGVLFLVMSRDSELVEVPKALVSSQAEDAEIAPQEISDSSRSLVNVEHPVDCIPIEMIGKSPDAYRVDEWYESWGAPRSFTEELSSRPYAHYDQIDLQQLSRNGDSEATHELGRDLVWRAFRGGERMLDYQTLWDIGGDPFPYDSRIDLEDLERARKYLYRAAIEGRIYALIDISVSYAHQMAVERNNGELDDERELELRMEIFSYGEAVEELVVGLPSSFFGTRIRKGEEEKAADRLSTLIDRFTLDRANQGLDISSLPSVGDGLLDGLKLCRD